MTEPTSLELAHQVEQAVQALTKLPPRDEELADVIGTMDRTEKLLAKTRRSWERVVHELEPIPQAERVRKPKRATTTEHAPRAQGQQYELQPKYTTVRSYNSPAILVAVQKATEWDTLRTLLELQRMGALRWTWTWTPLKKALADLRVPLRVAFEEVDDDTGANEAMVGEVKRQSGVKKVPITPDPPAVEDPLPEPPPDDNPDVAGGWVDEH